MTETCSPQQVQEQQGTIMTEKKQPVYRSGFVIMLGRPNVGKSSLVNALMGRKVAIVSPKPQTTRRRIQAVLTRPHEQAVLLDTPGIHRSGDLLGKTLSKAATEALEGVDGAILVVDAARSRGDEDFAAARLLAKSPSPKLLVINKMDLISSRAEEVIMKIPGELRFEGPVIAASTITGLGVDRISEWIFQLLKPGPMYFPADAVTDQPEEILIAELIREQILLRTEEEVPHDAAVKVEEIAERPGGMMYVRALVIVARAGQKAIILGAGGRMLKEIGSAARLSIEQLLGTRVYLDLWVGVEKDWRNKIGRLRELGYE